MTWKTFLFLEKKRLAQQTGKETTSPIKILKGFFVIPIYGNNSRAQLSDTDDSTGIWRLKIYQFSQLISLFVL
jgi:hypothetical protein